MSVWYSVYLEAKINGKWECISPLVKQMPEKKKSMLNDDDKEWKYATVAEGQSRLGMFLNDVAYKYSCDTFELSEDLLNNIVPKKIIDKLSKKEEEITPFSDEAYWSRCMYIVDSSDLVGIENYAQRSYSNAGFFTREEASRIKNGEIDEETYPIDEEDLPKDLPEYMFNALYEYVEYIDPYSQVQYAKEIMQQIKFFLNIFNNLNEYRCPEVRLSDCRLIVWEG